MIHRCVHVGPNGLPHECIRVVPELGLQQRLDRRTDAVDDRTQVPRLPFARLLELFQGGQDRPALRMAQDNHQPGPEVRGRELDAANLRRRHDVAGDTDDEQIAQPLVEDELSRHPRVRATEDDREGPLLLRQLDSARMADPDLTSDTRNEAAVSRAEAIKRFLGRRHGARLCTAPSASSISSAARPATLSHFPQGICRIACMRASTLCGAPAMADYERLRERHLAEFSARVPEHLERLRWPVERIREERERRLRGLLAVGVTTGETPRTRTLPNSDTAPAPRAARGG